MKILLVTPQAPSPDAAKTLLGRQGLRLIYAPSGIEAHNLVRFEHPELAIIDMALADMPGDEVCRDIKGAPETQHTIVAMLIDAGDEYFRERATAAGANVILDKPLNFTAIEQLAAKILNAPLRRTVRIPVRVMVDGRSTMGEVRGESVDLSSSGILLSMDRCDLEAGFKVWLKFPLDEGAQPVVCKGTIVRIQQHEGRYRLAIQFKEFSGEGAASLRRFLRSRGAHK